MLRRIDARVQQSVVPSDPVAEHDEIVEHRTEVRHENRCCLVLGDFAINGQPHGEFLHPENRASGAHDIRDESEPSFQWAGSAGDHRRVQPNSHSDRESLTRRQPAEIDPRLVAFEQRAHCTSRFEWNTECPRNDVTSSTRQNANRRTVFRQGSNYFDGGAIAAKGEHCII